MRFALVTLVVTTSVAAHAQSINVAFGGGAPSSTYAAAGAAGTWNAVSGVAGADYPLVDVDGNDTGVVVSQSPTTNTIVDGDASITGDDGALLNHGLLTTGDETCLSFQGFAPGDYEVLVYAWTPDAPSVLSRTRQDEAPSTIDVGGAWTGAHGENVTYARYVVHVDETGALPAHSGLAPDQPSAALNGVQIRPLSSIVDPPPPTSGTTHAPSTGTSRRMPIPTLGPPHTDPTHASTPNDTLAGGCSASSVAPCALAVVLLAVRRRRQS